MNRKLTVGDPALFPVCLHVGEPFGSILRADDGFDFAEALDEELVAALDFLHGARIIVDLRANVHFKMASPII